MDKEVKNDLPVDIESIYVDIRDKIYNARRKIYKHIDNSATEINWYVGKIASELLDSDRKNAYGKQMIDSLSMKLQNEFGDGFAPVSIRRMKRFYEYYPNFDEVPTELTWSHFQELIQISRKEERDFYMNEAVKSVWGVRELRRQIGTKIYDRLLISKDKDYVTEMSKQGMIVNKPEDILKAPYIFEFAGLKQNKSYLENDLQKALLNHLSEFLLELGRGFYYGGQKEKIKVGDEYYYPDLIFYNRLAKCFVIIDLKLDKLTHGDIGQMQMYVNYYKKNHMSEGENEPIGILLCASKNDTMVEMTLGDNKNIYSAAYLTYLPTKEELATVIEDEKERIEASKQEVTEV